MKPTLALHKLPLYNTGRLDDSDIIAAFAARQSLFDRIITDIGAEKVDSRAQHHLIVGQRGMGKTMLLSRIAAEIRTSLLGQHFIPLSFAEEQYAVDRLSKFWLNCLDSLADAQERTGNQADADRIDEVVKNLNARMLGASKDDGPLAREALAAFLDAAASLQRRPVLLVDNLQLVFERISDEQQHALRELLMRPGSPILIGASPSPPPESQDYGAAFYDHFKVHYLRPLEVEEMQALMLHLADAIGREDVRSRIISHPHRLKVLRQLTGGNPRTTATLFFLYAEDFAPTVFGDLENLLDRVTPLYKARFEELSTQQQVIASAIANHWDPVSSRALSEITGLPMTGISGQLDRMEKNGFIERVSLFGQSSTGYQIAERFFNVWFLMRSASRRQRREVEFLTRFIENFYDSEDRSKIATRLLDECDLSADRHLFAKALGATLDDKVFAAELDRHATLDALRQKAAESRRKLDEILDLSSLPPATLSFNKLREKLISLVPSNGTVAPESFTEAILGDRHMFMNRDRERLASSNHTLGIEEINSLMAVTQSHQDMDEEEYGKESTSFLMKRLASGQIRNCKDVEDWNRTILVCHDDETMRIILETLPDNLGNQLSEEARKKVLDILGGWVNGSHNEQLDRINILLTTFGTAEYAEDVIKTLENMLPINQAQLKAFKVGRETEDQVGETVLSNSDQDLDESVELIAPHDSLSEARHDLAISATEVMVSLHNLIGTILSSLLSRPADGEKVFLKALALDQSSGRTCILLGDLYSTQMNRPEDAKAAYAKARELEPDITGVKILYFYRDVLGDINTSLGMLDRLKKRPVSISPGEILQQEALFSAYAQNWGLASEALARALDWELEDVEITPQDKWPYTCAVLFHLNYGGEFLSLLEQRGDHLRLRPWFEALKALHLGDRGHLLNVAPEIRTTAESLYDAIKNHLDKLPESTRRRPLSPAKKKRRKN